MPGNINEFELYCQGKPPDAREGLRPVRQLILDAVPSVVHFHLVYHFGGGSVAKLHLDAKQQVTITFVTGEDLTDPAKLLKGPSFVRTIRSPRLRSSKSIAMPSATLCASPLR